MIRGEIATATTLGLRFAAMASVFLALLALSSRPAEAQSGAVCTISDTVARVVSDNPYTVALEDQCKFLVFTGADPIAVTLPNAAVTFPLGFRVAIRANGAGAITVTPVTSLINGGGAPVVLASGTAMDVWTDGTNYFTQAGAGSILFGTVNIDQTVPGTTNGVQVNAALPAGASIIGKVGIDQTTPGTTNAVAPIAGQNGVAAGAGTVGTTTQRVTLASNDPLVASSAAITGAAAITPHDVTTVAAGRQWLANCTVAGDVKVKFSDTSLLTIPMAIGLSTVPWAIIQVFITGTTATCSYYNLL